MRRIHRTFSERFKYLAIFECISCKQIDHAVRHYLYHLGEKCRCPRCGNPRPVKLRERDKIDPMQTGFLNLLERMAGGKLYHCCFCRVQFYDRRSVAFRRGPDAVTVTSPQDTAKSGA